MVNQYLPKPFAINPNIEEPFVLTVEVRALPLLILLINNGIYTVNPLGKVSTGTVSVVKHIAYCVKSISKFILVFIIYTSIYL